MKFRFGNGDQPLSGFTIKRGVGVGGFGDVYFALNDAGKEVALKQIQRNLDVEVRGVRQCMNVKHPNLIGLYDIRFDDQNQGWIVMEYVSGRNLREALEKHPEGMPREEVERWFGQLAAGVAYLHDHGIVHRDLKPANIFEDEGLVKIGDYGLSKFISCSRRGGQTESVGTFHYMAPEIGKGEYGKEIDIYALGIILYEMATGMVPFDGESSQEIIMKHLTADPDLSQLSPAMREVIGKALSKNPAARYSDVRQMLQPLGMYVDQRYFWVPRVASDEPPVVQTEPRDASQATTSSATTDRVTAHRPSPQRPHSAAPTAPRSRPGTTSVKYEEPIAAGLSAGWRGLNGWWAGLRLNPGVKASLLAIAIIFLIMNFGSLIPIAVMGLVLYIPYYVVWCLVGGPSSSKSCGAGNKRKGSRAAAAETQYFASANQTGGSPPTVQSSAEPPIYAQPMSAAQPRPVAANRPLSVRQWKLARRSQLAQQPKSWLWCEVSGSWMGAFAVLAVFSGLAVLFEIGSGAPSQPALLGMIWAALTALMISWIGILLGKVWQREEGDWAIRSFVQLTTGFLVGIAAYGLSEFLMVPWSVITREGLSEIPVHRWNGFFDDSGQPLLPAYLAYFPLLMGLIHWWKQVDPLRRTRLSFWAVVWSVLAAGIVHLLIPFPLSWGALIAAGSSLSIQLASPWINPNERLQVSGSTAQAA